MNTLAALMLLFTLKSPVHSPFISNSQRNDKSRRKPEPERERKEKRLLAAEKPQCGHLSMCFNSSKTCKGRNPGLELNSAATLAAGRSR